MKYTIFLFFSLLSFFAHSKNINGGIVKFGGYVFESSCEYSKDYNKLLLVCYENGNEQQYSYPLLASNEKVRNINSTKISEINLFKISIDSAITTISYR